MIIGLPLRIVRVSGDGMLPNFRQGDRVLAIRRGLAQMPRGAAVVARPDGRQLAIKRLDGLAGHTDPGGGRVPPGQVCLVDDADAGNDYREFVLVKKRLLWGVVIAKLR